MLKAKKVLFFCVAMLVIISAVNGGVVANIQYNSQQVDMLKTVGQEKIRDFIYNSDENIYDIIGFSFFDEPITNTDGKLSYQTDVRVQEKLKAIDIEEMAYVKGYLKGLGIDTYKGLTQLNKENIAKSKLGIEKRTSSSTSNAVKVMIEIVDDRLADLQSYIGKVSDFQYSFLVSIDIANLDNINWNTVTLEGIDGMGQVVDVNEFELRPEDEIYQSGVNDVGFAVRMAEEIQSKDIIAPLWVADPIDNWSNYDRLQARRYAYDWWGPYDSDYNPAYTNWNGQGGDCANFVSQCLKDGGIPTDSTWQKDSVAWIRTSSLADYMIQRGYATISSHTNATAGNFAYTKKNQGHVVLVTINDGSKICYTAHNSNVKDFKFTASNLNSSLPFDSSSDRYKFYVVKNFGGTGN